MSDVQFRRIRGRIVPIHVKQKAEGVAIASGGLAVAAASGTYASNLLRSAANAENAARTTAKQARFAIKRAKQLGPLFEKAANKEYMKAGHEAIKTMVKSRQLLKSSIGIRNAGYTAGAALIAGGVHHALKDKKTDSKTTAAIATGAGVAAQFAVKTGYMKSLGRSSMKLSDAMKAAAKAVVLKKFGR